MPNYKGIGYDNDTGRNRTGTASDLIEFDTSVAVAGNLDVTGNIISRDEQRVLVQDNFLDINFGYITNTGLSGGIAVNYKATTTGKTINTQNIGVAVINNGNVSDGDTVTVGSAGGNVVFTAKASGAAGQQFNIGGSASATATNLAAAIEANGAFSASVSSASNTVVEITSGGTSIATSDSSAFEVDANLSIDFDAAAGANRPKLTVASSSLIPNGTFAANDIIQISGTTNAENDGFYIVHANTDGVIEIKSTEISGSADTLNSKFAQVNFTNETETGGQVTIFKVNVSVLQANATSGTFETQQGDQDTDFSSFSSLGGSLQVAYDLGNTITTSGTNPVALTLAADNAGFSVQGNSAGDGVVSIGGTTAVDSFLVSTTGVVDIDAVGAVTVDGVTNITLHSAGIAAADNTFLIRASNSNVGGEGLLSLQSEGTLTLTGEKAGTNSIYLNASNAAGGIDIDAGTNGVSLDTAGALSMQSALSSDLTMATNTGSTQTLTIAASNADGSNVANIDIDADGAITADAVGALSLQGGASSDLTATAGELTLQATNAAGGVSIFTGTGGVDIDITSAGDGSGNGALTVNAGAASTIDTAVGELTLSASNAAGGVSIFGGTGGVDIDITSAGDGSGNGAFTVNAAAASTIDTSIGELTLSASQAAGGVTINAGTGGVDIDITNAGSGSGDGALTVNAAAASSIDVAGADLQLSTTTSGELGLTAAGLMDIDAGANLDIDVTGTFDMLSSGVFSIDGTGASNVTATSGNLTLSTATSGDVNVTSAADVDIDAAGAIQLDGVTSSNLTVTGAANSDRALALQATNSDNGANATATIDITASATGSGGAESAVNITGNKVKNILQMTAKVAIAVKQLVYIENDGGTAKVNLADASAIATAKVIGSAITSSSSDNDPLDIFIGGITTLLHDGNCAASNIGSYVYLSETAGRVTITPPSTANSCVVQVGVIAFADGTQDIDVIFQPVFIVENG